MSTLNNSRPQPAYPGGQQELYTLIETGWGSYMEHLAVFSAYKTIYTAQLATDQLAALAAARVMPDEASREEVHKTLRKKVQELSIACLDRWSLLDGYIMDAFPEVNYEDKRQAAGHGYYRGAQQEDWESVKGLMSSGLTFITNNTAVLTSDGGMTATFASDFSDLKTDFETHHQLFIQAEEQAKALTDAKIEANNALYRTLVKMFKDGQRLFRKQAAIRDQFIVERVMELINGGGGGGGNPTPGETMNLTGDVMHAVTGAPLANVEVTVMLASGHVKVLTDAGGSYAANGLTVSASEEVQVQFIGSGLEDLTESVTLVPGEDQVLNVAMVSVTAFVGQVTDTFGNPQGGATVRFGNAAGNVETQTDNNGNYNLRVSGPGGPLNGTLTAEGPGLMPSSRPVMITPGEEQVQNFMLSPMAPPPPPPPIP